MSEMLNKRCVNKVLKHTAVMWTGAHTQGQGAALRVSASLVSHMKLLAESL